MQKAEKLKVTRKGAFFLVQLQYSILILLRRLFMCQIDSAAFTDEDRQQKPEAAHYHLGDMANVYRHRSLVLQQNVGKKTTPPQGCVLYGTERCDWAVYTDNGRFLMISANHGGPADEHDQPVTENKIPYIYKYI